MFEAVLAQVPAPTFWSAPCGSTEWWIKTVLALLVGIGLMFGLMQAPPQSRKYIVGIATFVSGLFYVVFFYWPAPVNRAPGDLPTGPIEGFSFWLQDAVGTVTDFSTILSGFLLGLGIFSLVRIHGRRFFKMQRDWFFSLVLLVFMVLMVLFGYADWHSHMGPDSAKLGDQANWGLINYGKDFLFDGMFQQMDAAMFSLIAFYIISAAYRAFRIRSIEATILLATALIVILSLMGVVQQISQDQITRIAGPNPDSFFNNFTLSSVADWIKNDVQTPAIRGIDFGIGIGALAMGLRLWLSLEKAGGSS